MENPIWLPDSTYSNIHMNSTQTNNSSFKEQQPLGIRYIIHQAFQMLDH